MSTFHRLEVLQVVKETREAVAVRLAVPAPVRKTYRFQPGQYLTFRRHFGDEEVRRNYSICSTPEEADLTVAIKRVPGGMFSTWANEQLSAGESLEAMPPAGRFLRVPGEGASNYLAVAAGSGITPILSILRATLMAEPQARFTLIYGNRAAHAVMFREALEDLKNQYMARFALIHVLTREQQDVDAFNGRIDQARCDLLLRDWVDLEDLRAAYLCGPQGMMEAATQALLDRGVAAGRVHRELFVAQGAPAPRRVAEAAGADPGQCQVTVIQDGRRREFSMARGRQSVLRAALAQGIELPWSCQGGVCSTCRCKVIEGEVEMDTNFALEDYEIAHGFRLACQSFPLTARLVIDYDQHT